MKICCMADPHGFHDRTKFEEDADVLVVAGDLGGRTSDFEFKQFLTWLKRTPFKHKVFIAGNHDEVLERMRPTREYLGNNCHYLHNESVEIDDVRFWGSPYTPVFFNWHFMLPRGEHMKINWQFIPMDTDVLVSHGPPKLCGLGVCQDGTEAGDEDLFDRIMIVKPQLVVCGHIHEGYGEVDIIHGESKEESRTVVVNASMMDAQYRYVNKPIYKTVKQK